MAPTVSVIIPSYNHGRFIRQCIQSVLDQTFQDFEIIITDDGSSDRSIEIIEEFVDPRIKLFKHLVNKGASVASNNCIINSTGKYIAMLSSDDIWYPEKLEIQVNYLEAHPEISIVFGKVDWIDVSGNLLVAGFPYKDIFNVKNRTRFEWLRHFFKVGNCLCHPCSLIRRDHYLEVGLLDPSFANLPDFDLWVRFCLKYDIHILDQPLVYFRRINEQENASGDNITGRIRNRFEYKQILTHYLSIQDPNELLLIFPEAGQYGKVSSGIIPYFLSRVAIDSGTDFMMLWGLENIYTLLKNEVTAQMLEEQCGFTYLDFIKLAGQYDVYKMSLISMQASIPIKLPGDVDRTSPLFLAFKKYFRDLFLVFRTFLSVSKNFLKDISRVFFIN